MEQTNIKQDWLERAFYPSQCCGVIQIYGAELLEWLKLIGRAEDFAKSWARVKADPDFCLLAQGTKLVGSSIIPYLLCAHLNEKGKIKAAGFLIIPLNGHEECALNLSNYYLKTAIEL